MPTTWTFLDNSETIDIKAPITSVYVYDSFEEVLHTLHTSQVLQYSFIPSPKTNKASIESPTIIFHQNDNLSNSLTFVL